MSDRPYKRRRFFINRGFQGRAILRSVGAALVGGALLILILLALTGNSMTMSYRNAELRLQSTPLALMPEIITTYGGYAFIAALLVGAAALFVSHRVSGPAYRFVRHVEGMLRGDLRARIRLRKKDEIKELADKLNELTAMLEGRVGAINRSSATMRDAIEKLRDAGGPDVWRQAAEIEDLLEVIEDEAGFFSTEDVKGEDDE